MLRPINEIIRNTVGNIIHRLSIVTGEVSTDNGDGSYDVFIAGDPKAYPKIFTLARDPDIAVGDTVRILYKNGDKNNPIIWPPETGIPLRYALIVAYPNELQLFNMNGDLVKRLAVAGWSYAGCDTTVDSLGNVYIQEAGETIKKYDSNLNLLVTQEIESGNNWISAINIGNDGYLYTLEMIDEGYDVKKRSTIDLTIQAVIPLTDSVYYCYDGGMCLDSNGNIYVFNDPYIEKFSNSGVLLAQLETDGLSNEFAGFGICGSNVYFVKDTNKIYYAPLNLSSYTEWNLPSAIAYALTVADGHLILTGWDGDNDGATSKYDSDRNLIWTVKLTAASYGYKAGGYNF